MMKQMSALLRIKELKEERALRTMRERQDLYERACRETKKAYEIAEAYRVTIPERVDAIYNKVMRKVVALDNLDDVRADITAIENEYTSLKDDWERARQIEARRKEELEESSAAYKLAVRKKDKYVIITDRIGEEAQAEEALKEEIELEDLSISHSRRIA